MQVLFFGTSTFALPALQALHEASPRHTILAVVTQPDRPSGRGMKLHFSPVKELAIALGYTVLQPEKVRRKAFIAEASALAPDALVVVSFGQIIPQTLLDLPRYGGINVHGSLLPRWRGAAPIHHAIIAGDSETGVATMQMEASLDTGPVFRVASEPIRPTDTVASLEPRLAALGGPLLIETLDALEAGTIAAAPQPAEGMTYASPVTRADGLLDPLAQTAAEMVHRIAGTHPRPGAFLTIGDRTVRVIEATAIAKSTDAASERASGSVLTSKAGVTITTADGSQLLITRVQPENKGAMSAADWSRGTRLGVESMAARPAD